MPAESLISLCARTSADTYMTKFMIIYRWAVSCFMDMFYGKIGLFNESNKANCNTHPSEWVSEWLNLMVFLGTADSEVHIVHRRRVIKAYTLESSSSLTQIIHNLHTTIYFEKKKILKKKHKKWGHPFSWLVIGDGNSTSVYNCSKY